MRSRNARGEGTRLRDEILASADALLEETGSPEAVTLRAVARGAGVTAPSIYAHFADRDEIVSAMMERAFVELTDALEASVSPDDDPVTRLYRGCHAYLDFARTNPQRYAVLFRRARVEGTEPITRAEFEGLSGSEGFDVLANGIAACVAAGRSTSPDPFADAIALWVGLHGYATLRASNPVFPWPADDAVVDTLVQQLARLT